MTRFTLLFVLAVTTAYAQPVSEKQKKGQVTNYYPGSKQVYCTGPVQKHLREGTWTFYAPGGEPVKKEQYKAGLLHGVREVFTKNKTLVSEQFAGNKLHGAQRYYDTEGVLVQEQFFTAGEADSIFYYGYDTKNTASEKRYLKNGQVYRIITFYAKGEPRVSGWYDTEGLKTGVWRTYNRPLSPDDTIPFELITYVKGKRNGFCRIRENKIVTECNFTGDLLEGEYRRNGLDGTRYTATYKNGKLEGVSREYKSGKLLHEITYAGGNQTGVALHFYESGDASYKEYYSKTGSKDAFPDSTVWFYASGKRMQRLINHAENSRTGAYQEDIQWYENGRVKETGNRKGGDMEGAWKWYAANGRLTHAGYFRNGEAEGLQEMWYENGRKKLEVTCKANVALGYPKAWNPDGTTIDTRSPKFADWWYMNQPGNIVLYTGTTGLDEDEIRSNVAESDVDQGPEIRPDLSAAPVKQEVVPESYTNKKPQFPGGEAALEQFIREQLQYPASEKARNNEAVVQLTLIIRADGRPDNIYAFRKPADSPAFGWEAMRMAATMPKWIPGEKNGKPVDVAITLDVPFRISQ